MDIFVLNSLKLDIMSLPPPQQYGRAYGYGTQFSTRMGQALFSQSHDLLPSVLVTAQKIKMPACKT